VLVSGGIPRMLRALHSWKTRSEDATATLCALNSMYLLASGSGLDGDVLPAIVREGGVTVLLETMRHYESDSGVLQTVCEVLRGLADNDVVNCIPDIVAGGGVDLIVSAWRRFSGDVGMVTAACAVLTCLTPDSDRDTRHMIGNAGSYPSLPRH
jgi:hypothetical protein